ncbi:hypothetical protein L9F63_020953, partial [Diploptera punctata]
FRDTLNPVSQKKKLIRRPVMHLEIYSTEYLDFHHGHDINKTSVLRMLLNSLGNFKEESGGSVTSSSYYIPQFIESTNGPIRMKNTDMS